MRFHKTITRKTGCRRRGLGRGAAITLLAVICVWGVAACGQSGSGTGSGPGGSSGGSSGNLEGGIRTAVPVGNAVITVNSMQAAFQPVSPAQKLSDEPLVAPASGYTFYQAYVRIENRGQIPLRIDAEDFVCRIGNTISTLEPTRSGPSARSIIYGTSLDLVLTFRGVAGAEPTLIYSPSWYDGIVTFSAGTASSATTTTIVESPDTTATTEVPIQ